MSKLRVVVRVLAAIMVTIASVAAGLYYASFAHDHQDYVGRILLYSIVSALVLAVIWMLTSPSKGKEDINDSVSIAPIASPSGNGNSAIQNIAQGELNTGINNSPIFGTDAIKEIM